MARIADLELECGAMTTRIAELNMTGQALLLRHGQTQDRLAAAEARALAAEAALITLQKVFAPILKRFGPEWPDGTGLDVVLGRVADEDEDEGTGPSDLMLGQLRRALAQPKEPTK